MMSKCTPQVIKNPMVQASKDEKSIAEISRITHKPWSSCKDILKSFGTLEALKIIGYILGGQNGLKGTPDHWRGSFKGTLQLPQS